MYNLVAFDNDGAAVARRVVTQSTDVMAAVRQMMADYPGCYRVEIHVGPTRLFTIDYDGSSSPG